MNNPFHHGVPSYEASYSYHPTSHTSYRLGVPEPRPAGNFFATVGLLVTILLFVIASFCIILALQKKPRPVNITKQISKENEETSEVHTVTSSCGFFSRNTKIVEIRILQSKVRTKTITKTSIVSPNGAKRITSIVQVVRTVPANKTGVETVKTTKTFDRNGIETVDTKISYNENEKLSEKRYYYHVKGRSAAGSFFRSCGSVLRSIVYGIFYIIGFVGYILIYILIRCIIVSLVVLIVNFIFFKLESHDLIRTSNYVHAFERIKSFIGHHTTESQSSAAHGNISPAAKHPGSN